MATGLFNLKQVNQAISQGAWSGYIAPKWVEYLVVAGGGGGGYVGGGGAGGLLTGVVTVAAGTSYTVTVGTGGAGSSSGLDNAAQGVASVFGSISATGGGAGLLNYISPASKNNGGSGGGGGINIFANGQGTSGQGNAGGQGSANNGGGGGGAGTTGLNASTNYSGNGGAGIASSITGVVTTYAGGGGAGSANSININSASGGVGGGGSAGPTTGGNGSANTGGGGGGACYVGPTFYSGGNGGSGIVVVRYPGNVQFYTGGTVNYNNGYIIHIFTSSGTLAPTTPTPYNTSYQISRSLRFNSADSANLTRTPASATNQKTWTWSGWVKRSALYANSTDPATLFNAGGNGFLARFSYANPDQLEFYNYSSSAFQLQIVTTPQYRDVSAWYHIVFALDTTQATSSDRFKVYVNGTQVTAFGTATYPSQNADMLVNGTTVHALGVLNGIGGYYNGYMTEINFVDGQALTPSSFGATSTTNGVWAPIQYTGTYGTNGFYLNFSDNSNTTAATLGKDYSGNGNNWTPNNFSVTAGAGNDSLVDSPTAYGFDTGVGGTVRGNYCTLNPLDAVGTGTILDGNLQLNGSSGAWYQSRCGFGLTSGKWYWEVYIVDTNEAINGICIGIASSAVQTAGYNTANQWSYNNNAGGRKGLNTVSTAYGTAFVTGNTVGVAFDADAGSITFYVNNSSQGVAASSGLPNPAFPTVSAYGTDKVAVNFGQRPFAYTAPSGYKALCTQNLPTPTIGATSTTLATSYFNPATYTGTNATQSITTGFQPDLVWIKSRSQVSRNTIFDAVRGVTKVLWSDSTDAEGTASAGTGLTSLNSNGFTLGTEISGTSGSTNVSGVTYVAWNWKANGSGSTNTAGSITSTVSANTTSGFSIVTYTGNGTTGTQVTVGHGLGVAPSMIILKDRSNVNNWVVYTTVLGSNKYLYLNTTAAAGSVGPYELSPTSSVFYIQGTETNASSHTYVAYCFAEVAGYSKFGSYVGNGSTDGPFAYTGFKPAYIMAKSSSNIGSWVIYDAVRNTYNVVGRALYADLSDAEYDTPPRVDFLSNGFKLRSTGEPNNSGRTFIYMAFAENPFKFSLAR